MKPLEGIIGHPGVVALLREEAEHPGHAYLFVGPANAGKATMARHFAAAVIGGDKETRRRALAGVHPDVVLVEPDGRTALTVDRARSVVERAALTPVEGSRQVFVFPEAGLMTDEAANALLKTLEEPTTSSVFILVAESEDDLPDTIASRCRTIVFGRVSHDEIVAALAVEGVDTEQAEKASRISGGRPGLALALATRPEVAEYRRAWLAIPLEVSASPGKAYLLADEIIAAAGPLLDAIKARQEEEAERSGGRLIEQHERELRRASAALYQTGLEMLASWYRDAVAGQVGAPVRNPDIPPKALTSAAPDVAMHNAIRVLDAIDRLDANQRPQLALAALFAELGAEA